jgi:2,4-dienoyl-CoA reductase-like NADH-dependent reductase (Old Yellow Enzyme family)
MLFLVSLPTRELPGVVLGFRKAAEYAQAAGFDGVVVHGANGYLLDQFLRNGTDQRDKEIRG